MNKRTCYHCGGDAYVEHKGVIYVRTKVNDKWENVPCCYPCWQMKYRGVKKEDVKPKLDLNPQELVELMKNTPNEKKFEVLMQNLPKNLFDFKMLAEMIYSMTKKMNDLRPELMRPEFTKLNELAHGGDITAPEKRKHRRACMAHPFTCEHRHCQSLSKFLTDTGMDKVCNPEYGEMSKTISKDEEETTEGLK